MAQDNLWSNGGQLLDFNDPQGPMSACSLPTGNDYTGTPAQYSQNAQYDETGKLLFFVVDGNIYDQAGYLMADNDADPQNCRNCLVKGLQEILITPMPGTCDKYFIIGGNTVGEYNSLGYSVLDLSKPSLYYPDRKGAVWDLADVDQAVPNMADQMQAYSLGITTPQVDLACTCVLGSTGTTATRSKNAHLCLLDGPANAEPRTLFVETASYYKYGSISNQGIAPLQWFRSFGNSPDDDVLVWSGANAVSKGSTDGVVRLARTVNNHAYPLNDPNNISIEISQVTFTGIQVTDQVLASINTDLTSSHQGAGTVHGLAFSPSGRYLYFAQASVPYIGYIDMLDASYTVHDLVAQLGLSGMNAFGYGQIACNKGPGGVGWSMYFPSASGIGCLNDIENPGSPTFTWTASVSAGTTPLAPPPNSILSTAETPGWNQYLMDKQNYRDQQIPNLQRQECCQDNERIPEASHLNDFSGTTTQADPWTPDDNELTDPILCPAPPGSTGFVGHAYFEQDYIVHTGARLYVQDMDWRFAPTARLIIERGAFVKFTNCLLQGTLDENCEPRRWPGIRVEGNTTASQFPMVNGAQGYLYLANTTVANAVVGVWCERESGNYPAGGYAGGIVRAYSSTIKNCLTGVRIANYPNSQHSSFTTTTFITDTDRPDLAPPYANALISNTRIVYFNNCSFLNQSGDPALMNGIGVLAFNGQVNVNGGTIDNLTYGVVNVAGALAPSTVNNVHFTRNVWGIHDLATSYSRYTNNQFDVPGDGNTMIPSVGMYLWQPQGYTIERNTFTGDGNSQNVGIYFKGISPLLDPNSWVYTDNQIYNNTFTGLYAGSIVKDIHRNGGYGKIDAGLSLFCGDFTDNIYDIALLESSIIKPDQGYPNQQLSGNRFLTTANCTNSWDWNLDPAWNHVQGWYNDMHLNVFRNDDPVCDVQCEWPDFADIPVGTSDGGGIWTANGACGDGLLDHEHTIPGDVLIYHLAKSQLDAALDAYNGNLDAGEKPDLIDLLIKQEPPLPSSTLRNTLLANSPLSDEVMVTMLKREPAMDPWHLTQVLVANVKLNPGVISLAKELLSPFYFGVVDDAQEGSGADWKQLMEQEIEQRRREKAQALASLGYMYGTDSTYEGGVDSLRLLLATDTDPDYTQVRTAMYISDGDWSAAETELTGPAERLNGWQTYTDLWKAGADHDGQWDQLTGSEVDVLDQHMRAGGAGAAMAGGILFSHHFTEYVPEVQFPREGPAPRLVPATSVATKARPALALYPNPASTEAYLTWPVEQKGDEIQIMDAQGRILLVHQAEENGVSRLDLSKLPAGLYKVYLNGSGLSVSFSIVR
ncbi:MAG: T9SS type A sorting domain-containing protein [Flavobacteriales bacterium]|nr:T9SS type A sorting domain-containing protein [Flavobacteriales bacterium]